MTTNEAIEDITYSGIMKKEPKPLAKPKILNITCKSMKKMKDGTWKVSWQKTEEF